VLPGRDPAAANEVVILGAHYDHLGQGPDGTIWPGANDNASGVAVLLEIARTWQAQGYVPRRTVVFAAWDAEEQGLLGSIHYAAHPRYPLEDTVAMLQLDMVGAGAGALALDGEPGLLEHLLSVAEALAIPTAEYPLGRSDHVPFLEAGVPAGLLIWWDPDQAIPHYHRPGDTDEQIVRYVLVVKPHGSGWVVDLRYLMVEVLTDAPLVHECAECLTNRWASYCHGYRLGRVQVDVNLVTDTVLSRPGLYQHRCLVGSGRATERRSRHQDDDPSTSEPLQFVV